VSHTPLISILVPVYNKENYLKESINSLLNQAYPYIEILIYDDSSTDDSIKIIESFKDNRIFLYKGSLNKGVRYGRDFLLKKAKGEFISFFDADDICHKNKYIVILNKFKKNQNIDIIGSRVKYVDSKGKKLFKPFTFESFTHEDIKANLFFCNTISTSTVVFKKEVSSEINFQKFEHINSEDYFTWIQLSENYNFINIPNKLVTYRETDHGMMANTKNSYPKSINYIHSYLFNILNLTSSTAFLTVHNKFMYDDNISKYYLLKSLILYKYLLQKNSKYNSHSFLNQIRINWLRKCIIFSRFNPIESYKIYLFNFKYHNIKSVLKIYILFIFSLKFKLNLFINGKK